MAVSCNHGAAVFLIARIRECFGDFCSVSKNESQQQTGLRTRPDPLYISIVNK